MAKFRTAQAAISKTFERTDALVYLVSGDSRLQYANPACCLWVGSELDEIFGEKLVYTSDEISDPTQNQLKGLSVPKDFWNENELSESSGVHRFFIFRDQPNPGSVEHQTNSIWRPAIAFRFDQPDTNTEDSMVLVIALPPDLTELPQSDSADGEYAGLHQALAEIRLRSQSVFQVDQLVGTSLFAKRIRHQVQVSGDCHCDLLIVGPDGCGKQHLARTIFQRRQGSSKTELIPVDCEVADGELLMAIFEQLSDDREWRAGESAGPGDTNDTLLLLDVDRLGLEPQLTLIAELEKCKKTPAMIATSSRPLTELAQRGELEPQLATRIGTITIDVIALCQRAEDIPLLAQSFLERHNVAIEADSNYVQKTGFSKPALNLLLEFAWPGNIKQLKQIVDQAVVNSKQSLIEVVDFPKKFHDALSAQRIGRPAKTEIELDSYLESIERELIARAIKQADNNKAQAARLLGISRAKLIRRFQYFGLAGSPSESNDDSSALPEPIDPSAFKEVE